MPQKEKVLRMIQRLESGSRETEKEAAHQYGWGGSQVV